MTTSTTSRIKASVILRAYNEEKHIGKLLHEIRSQKVDFEYEIILVDSGSSDRTVEIAESFGVRLVQIKPSEFTFGFSLNKGIEIAQGEFCLMISAHCYPSSHHWMSNLVKGFEDSEVMLVYGKQRGNHMTKYSEHQVFYKWFPEASADRSLIPFCNNANSAIRKSFWDLKKYDEKLSGLEDLDMAKFVFAQKKEIAYRADASVYHIHEETPQQVFHRYYREGLAYHEIYPELHFGLLSFVSLFVANVMGDWLHAIQDGLFFKVFFEVLEFRLMQFWGTYRGRQNKAAVSREMLKRIYFPRRPQVTRNSDRSEPPRFQVIDISRPMTSTLPVWPGSRTFELTPLKNIPEHGVKESELAFNIHTGTHMDAPGHFVAKGGDVSGVRLEKMIGTVRVAEYLKMEPIDVDFFEALKLTKSETKILLKTFNSLQLFKDGQPFNPDFVAITSAAAQWLVDHGVDLIGIDGPSIQGFHDRNNATHEILLGAEVVVIEGLQLSHVNTGTYTLIALPLNIKGAEGAPLRAVLLEGNL